MSIEIANGRFKFINPNNIGLIGKQEDFDIPLKSIKIIGIKLAVILDDCEAFIVFVDDKQNIFILNPYFFDEQSIKKLQEVFSLSLDFASYEDKEYEKGRSIIIYPDQYFGKPLFKRSTNFFEATKLLFDKLSARKNPAWSYLSDESKSIIASGQ